MKYFPIIAAYLALASVAPPIDAAEPDLETGDIVGLEMAGPAMAQGTPAMWFGVKSCSTYVIFLVFDYGYLLHLDVLI
jgi:hypothetical protein